MSKSEHVLVTGGTGCLGSMIIDELLKEGYTIRATARPKKTHYITQTFPDAGDRIEVVEMDDLVTGDWEKAMKGIDAVIHVATPVSHPWVTGQEIFDAATTGMKRILKAACESGTVKKFVHTGAIGVFFNMDFSNVLTNVTFDENTWSSVEEGDVDPTTMQPFNTYVGAKIISEKLMWRAAEQYPHMDCTSILTTCVYGRFLPNYPAPQKEDDFNGNKFIYQFIKTKDRYFPPVPMTAVIHNRDNARAHVRSLAAPPLPKGEKKRLITTAGYMPWDEAVEYIKEKRPELKDRLPDMSKITLPAEHFVLDNKLTEKVLGMKSSDMIQWREILLESLDFLLEWEKGVKEGHNGEA